MRVLSGRYRLIEPIGSGGMSVVRRARDEVLGRNVAVKLLRGASDNENTLRAEAQNIALLNHPNITAVHDYGVAGGEPYVVMELVDGASLADVLSAGPLPWREAVEVCSQVASALAAAHERGLVHRDVTATNVMLTATGAKVVDFGIATVIGMAGETEIIGTPAYLAPERRTGAVGGPEADVYALGILLFTALTGQLPWPLRAKRELLRPEAQPGALPTVPGLPGEVPALYERCVTPAASHNADIAAGKTVADVGTNLDGSGAGNRIPDNFRLNGRPCSKT